jgi:hypothetical protein
MTTVIPYVSRLFSHLINCAYQKASLKAVLGLFLDAQGHALPAHTCVKSPVR